MNDDAKKIIISQIVKRNLEEAAIAQATELPKPKKPKKGEEPKEIAVVVVHECRVAIGFGAQRFSRGQRVEDPQTIRELREAGVELISIFE